MKISVVIPVYNEEKTLPVLLKSLKQQDLPSKDFEVIIVDNRSSDNTSQVAKAYGARIIYEPKPGIIYARSCGVKAAKGQIIVGTDADCKLPKDFLSSIYQEFSKNPKLYGLCGSVRLPEAWFINTMATVLSFYAHFNSKVFKTTQTSWALNLSFRKKAYLKVGGYTIFPELVEKGIIDGSDECNLVNKFVEAGGYVKFNKNIALTASARRFKGRLLYWFFAEYLLGYIINRNLYRLTGQTIPTPSYFTRQQPSRKQNVALRFVLTTLTLTIISSTMATIYSIQNQGINKQKLSQSLRYYQGYERQLVDKITQPIITAEPFRMVTQP